MTTSRFFKPGICQHKHIKLLKLTQMLHHLSDMRRVIQSISPLPVHLFLSPVSLFVSLHLCLSYVCAVVLMFNQPESSHWLIGYDYIIRGSWGLSYGSTLRLRQTCRVEKRERGMREDMRNQTRRQRCTDLSFFLSWYRLVAMNPGVCAYILLLLLLYISNWSLLKGVLQPFNIALP